MYIYYIYIYTYIYIYIYIYRHVCMQTLGYVYKLYICSNMHTHPSRIV